MSILVKGVDMPTDCVYCKWHTRWGCGITGIRTNTAQGCPIIEVPTPHGRLIDADELYKNYQEICSDIACTTCPFLNEDGCEVEQMIMYAPTIIEAEEGEEA